jgi:hypothetical protein
MPLFLALTACGPQQILAIPGATLLPADTVSPTISQQAPVVSVLAGSTTLAVGQSATLRVDVTPITDYTVSGISLWTLELSQEWIYPLSAAEQAAGIADITMMALDREPESCTIPDHPSTACSQDADDGVSTGALWAEGEAGSGWGAPLPLRLPPAAGTEATCSTFTLDDCCFTSGGTQSLACWVDPACGCPAGTSGDGTVLGDGTTMCTCPA